MKSFIILSIFLLNIIMTIDGKFQFSYKVDKKSTNLVKKLKYLSLYIHNIIHQYKKRHSVYGYGYSSFPSKKNLASTCKQKANLQSLPDRANEILKILQIFVGEMQQMQIDESRLPKGNYEIVKSLRHIEFDLREITESTMRKEIATKLGSVRIHYHVGSLPNTVSPYWKTPKQARAMIVRKLYMLLSCIGDVRHFIAGSIWQNLSSETNNTKDHFGKKY